MLNYPLTTGTAPPSRCPLIPSTTSQFFRLHSELATGNRYPVVPQTCCLNEENDENPMDYGIPLVNLQRTMENHHF